MTAYDKIRRITPLPIRRAARVLRRLTQSSSKWLSPRYTLNKLRAWALRTFLGFPQVLKDKSGIAYLVDRTDPLFQFLYHGHFAYYEIAEQTYCKRTVSSGMTVFDVGANHGQFSILFSKLVGTNGIVYAFEPWRNSAHRLRINLLLNNVTNVCVQEVGVYAEENSLIEFNIFPEQYSQWNTLGSPSMRASGGEPIKPRQTISIPTVTVDGFCNSHEIEHIDYLKIDVEGAEFDVLRGAKQMLARHRIKHIQFEVSQEMILGMRRTGNEVFELLAEFGYNCYEITNTGSLGPRVTGSDKYYANYVATPAK